MTIRRLPRGGRGIYPSHQTLVHPVLEATYSSTSVFSVDSSLFLLRFFPAGQCDGNGPPSQRSAISKMTHVKLVYAGTRTDVRVRAKLKVNNR